MPRCALILTLAALALAGCNRVMVPASASMPDQKPALSAPPSSVMTPNGY